MEKLTTAVKLIGNAVATGIIIAGFVLLLGFIVLVGVEINRAAKAGPPKYIDCANCDGTGRVAKEVSGE